MILYRLLWGFIPAFPTTNGRFPASPGHIEILSEASCDGRPWATQRIKWSLPEWEPVEDTRVLLGLCRDNGKENRKLLGTVLRNFRCAPGVELLAPCSSVYNPDLISVTFREGLLGGEPHTPQHAHRFPALNSKPSTLNPTKQRVLGKKGPQSLCRMWWGMSYFMCLWSSFRSCDPSEKKAQGYSPPYVDTIWLWSIIVRSPNTP